MKYGKKYFIEAIHLRQSKFEMELTDEKELRKMNVRELKNFYVNLAVQHYKDMKNRI